MGNDPDVCFVMAIHTATNYKITENSIITINDVLTESLSSGFIENNDRHSWKFPFPYFIYLAFHSTYFNVNNCSLFSCCSKAFENRLNLTSNDIKSFV